MMYVTFKFITASNSKVQELLLLLLLLLLLTAAAPTTTTNVSGREPPWRWEQLAPHTTSYSKRLECFQYYCWEPPLSYTVTVCKHVTIYKPWVTSTFFSCPSEFCNFMRIFYFCWLPCLTTPLLYFTTTTTTTTTTVARNAIVDEDVEIRSCVWNILWPFAGYCNQLTPWSRDLLEKLSSWRWTINWFETCRAFFNKYCVE